MYNHGMEMGQLNLKLFALVGVIMLVLAGTSFGYLFRLKNKSRASYLLMWFFLCVCGSAAATILTNLGTSWERAFAPAQDALLILGGVYLVRFAYIYPRKDEPQEARLVTILYSGLALFCLGYALLFALNYFIGLPRQFDENRAFYIITPLAVLLVAGLFFRRFYHWRNQPDLITAESGFLNEPGAAPPASPVNQQAVSALRDYGIALSLGLIPVVVTVLPDAFPGLQGILLSFLFNFGVVLAISALMLVYLSHAPDPTTISARLVGISLATAMLILGLTAVWVILIGPGEQTSEMVLTFIILVLLSGLLILLGFPLFFRFTLLLPLEHLLEGVRRANEGDLKTRVTVMYDDEVGFLTRSFNRMTRTLNEKSLALQEATANLEQEVAVRTAELAQTNDQLKQENEKRQAAQAQLDRQLLYERAFSQCAAVLSVDASAPEDVQELLSRAIEPLRSATGASHAQLFENFYDPESGFCSRMIAESTDIGAEPFLNSLQVEKIPWSLVPQENRLALEKGKAVGGAVTQVFASAPGLLAELQQDGIHSVQFFPIYLKGQWWGYIGFDDHERTQEWGELEILLLETASEIVGSFLARSEKERSLEEQNSYQRALASCSRVLLRPAATEDERVCLLNEALDHLRECVMASRAYILQNKLDPLEGETMGILAESTAPRVPPHRPDPVNQNFPWKRMPLEMYAALRERQPYGGPVEVAFASTPRLVQAFLSQQPPLLSLQLFPVHLYDTWWGFFGFDDCMQPRHWKEAELQVLRTGAEMITNVLLRWQREDRQQAQALAQEALARSSQRLIQPAGTEAERRAALTEALGFLVEAASASRGAIYANIEHPQEGLSLERFAEASAPGVDAHQGGPFAARVPWALLPPETRSALEQGEPVGCPVEAVLAGSPEIQDALESDPALSVQFFPIHFGARWWGMVGFDDIETPRAWGSSETTLLRTGAEIFSQTLQRWEAEDQLQESLNALEVRVHQRTRQLTLANARLLEEIEERRGAQQNLKNQLAIETILAGISVNLMAATDLDTEIHQSLGSLGDLFEARRISLILLAERQDFVIDNMISWQGSGVQPFSKEEAQYLSTTFSWSAGQLARFRPVYFQPDMELPVEAHPERLFLVERGIESLLLVPLVVQNELIGVLVCENIQTPGEVFDDASRMLEVAAGILSSALAHQRLLDDLEGKINMRTRELAALYDLAILGGQSARLSDVLLPMLSRILEITSSEAICLHLVEEDHLRLVVHLGLNRDQIAEKEQIVYPAAHGWLNQEFDLVDRQAHTPQEELDFFSIPDFPQMRLVRLRASNYTRGILSCYRRSELPYSPYQNSTLAAIGEQLGVIIENHRLRMEAEVLASLHERQRLARELHDSVSQSLYSLTLFARAGRDALESGNFEKLTQSLAEVEESGKYALREMRLLLYQLRSEAVDQGLSQALTDRFAMVEHRLGIRTELAIENGIQIDPAAEQELFWLVSEALNNVIKHSGAEQVFVKLTRVAAGLELSIRDDGEGFDPQNAKAGIGLDSMRERAELLGGELEIRSQPGSGTQVRLVLPAETSADGM